MFTNDNDDGDDDDDDNDDNNNNLFLCNVTFVRFWYMRVNKIQWQNHWIIKSQLNKYIRNWQKTFSINLYLFPGTTDNLIT
jgi:hypothetical protein